MLNIFGNRIELRRRLAPELPQGGRPGPDRLTLADVLRLRAEQAETGKPPSDTSVILIWKGGGPSHIDTWDLKPDAPAEYRGEFKPIATNVAGIQISEHLPLFGPAHG